MNNSYKTSLLKAEDVSLYARVRILEHVSLNLCAGDFHVLLGPNGAGKTSFLKVLCGDSSPSSGSVLLSGKPVSDYSIKELAQRRSVLPQLNSFMFPMTVYEVCALGRTPYMGITLSAEDRTAIEQALSMMELQSFVDRDYAQLSGGEQQRVQIARILCQQTGLLFLDEPLNALDIRHQLKVLDLLQQLTRGEGKSIVCVMHDINLALQYASHVSFLKQGKLYFQGEVKKVGEAVDTLSEVYDVDMDWLEEDGQSPRIRVRGWR